MRFHIHTLGCKTNLADELALAGALRAAGHDAAEIADADLILVNSCSVTGRADTDARQFVSRVRRVNGGARVVVTGCLAERDPEQVLAWPGVDEVVGNRDKTTLLARFANADADGAAVAETGDTTLWDAPTSYPQFREAGYTRAFVKVQDGCDAKCSFCVIPQTRGRSRSLEPARVEAAVAALGESGAREVVLTGIHLGHYGLDLGTSLGALLARLARLRAPRRIRLTSIEPNELTPDLVAGIADEPRLTPHFHLPLQSGSDRILGRMRRPYTARRYRRAVETIARHLPYAGIGADVIVGFPGETDADFSATVELLRALPITYLHVFSYSARPGTDAARMPEAVDSRVIRERNAVLRALSREAGNAFRRRLHGRRAEILTLDARADGTHGLSEHFVKVTLPAGLPVNELVAAEIDGRGAGARGLPLPAHAAEVPCSI